MKKYLICLVILLLSACASETAPIESGKDLRFYVATDIHLLSKDLMKNDELMAQVFEYGDGRFVHYSNEIMSTLSDTVKNNEVDVLILSGDLTHDGEKASHLAMAAQLKEIEKNGTRVFVVPGNHDLENPFAKDYAEGGWVTAETITKDDFEDIYKNYGYKEAISRDPNGLSYLVAPSEDVYLLMLDSNKYGMLNMPTGGGVIKEETLEWIKEATQIARDANAQIITVMHHNLIKHSERLYQGYVINNSEEVVPVFDELGLSIVLSGHMHAQSIKSTEQKNHTIYDIVTSSMSIYPMNVGVLEYKKNEGFSYHLESLDIESWAKVNSTDPNLLNFNAYSKEMNYLQNYNRAVSSLIEEEYDVDESLVLSDEVVQRLKNANFNGVIRQIKNELLILHGYKTESEIESIPSIQPVTEVDIQEQK